MRSDATPILELRGVSKTYAGGVIAAADVSFSVSPGELVALAGESGCGKTTTLKLINRLEDASGGCVLFEGQNVAERDPVALRRSIGWVMQGDGLFPHFSVAENIAVVPRLLGWDEARIELRLRELMEMMRLDADTYRDRAPSELSGGQRQRIGFARALAVQPDLVLLDEAFSALDPITRDGLQQDFKTMQRALGFAAVMVTHDMAEALILADRILVMRDGRVVQSGSPRDLLAEPADDYVAQLLETPRRQMAAIAELGA